MISNNKNTPVSQPHHLQDFLQLPWLQLPCLQLPCLQLPWRRGGCIWPGLTAREAESNADTSIGFKTKPLDV